MTEEQIAAFTAASLSKPEAVHLLMLGLYACALLLWCAWSLLGAWRGVCHQRISWHSFGLVSARSVLLLLIGFWLMLS